MSSRRISAVVLLALVVFAVVGARAWTPAQHMADMRPKVDLETMFPKSFGDWRIDSGVPVQLVSPDQAAILNQIYNQTLSRVYVNSQHERIMLSVAYGGDQSDGTRAHRPEVCYPAQGFQLLSSQSATLDVAGRTLPVRRLVAKLDQRVEPITYWTTVGERIALSGTEQKLAQLAYSTRGIIPDGMLVRVSSIDVDRKRAFRIQQEFIDTMALAIPVELQPQIIGRVGAESKSAMKQVHARPGDTVQAAKASGASERRIGSNYIAPASLPTT